MQLNSVSMVFYCPVNEMMVVSHTDMQNCVIVLFLLNMHHKLLLLLILLFILGKIILQLANLMSFLF